MAKYCKCMYDYDAGDDDELTFVEGDIIQVSDDKEEGWWTGTLKGKKGTFPSNFVEKISEEEGRSALGLPTLNPPIIRKKPGSIRSLSPAKETATAEYDYEAQDDDEVSFSEGDKVEILDKKPGTEGWWKVKHSNGKVGLVPDNFFIITPSSRSPRLSASGPSQTSPAKSPPSDGNAQATITKAAANIRKNMASGATPLSTGTPPASTTSASPSVSAGVKAKPAESPATTPAQSAPTTDWRANLKKRTGNKPVGGTQPAEKPEDTTPSWMKRKRELEDEHEKEKEKEDEKEKDGRQFPGPSVLSRTRMGAGGVGTGAGVGTVGAGAGAGAGGAGGAGAGAGAGGAGAGGASVNKPAKPGPSRGVSPGPGPAFSFIPPPPAGTQAAAKPAPVEGTKVVVTPRFGASPPCRKDSAGAGSINAGVNSAGTSPTGISVPITGASDAETDKQVKKLMDQVADLQKQVAVVGDLQKQVNALSVQQGQVADMSEVQKQVAGIADLQKQVTTMATAMKSMQSTIHGLESEVDSEKKLRSSCEVELQRIRKKLNSKELDDVC
ncbi:CD2-associated protein-like isoform X2 [Sycon ciliatum]|uniref:CD2-associated protein-like isoform X2 n=1 Tax=Sycon ciliatum TaxID=27933 RepID=UPI0031F5F45C